ncbi:hypothetical protein E2C00_32165 [Streptomyces sp. WAC05374]|uniref:hypothetical protein n=1 Tax=Streptomyces sp. WAC05374 TaxID=2487420 RepID=UPI000F86381C|nr:hypothetical protein [Streptomyces sp. WAC05374]RST14725.1 hypothetical protein EF905_16825 [Streptomyces sp. WAC05374]TDF42912.1 hypothetical protein E2B92_20890 [Streptomyces sp. WAC05374]TDF47754.1 hypothetical protein E2C00_32165 [Streptomyces sp. WAC05374]TDF48974.1 hypothetical protein E2C02_28175 [Streptomyces sp. WAC05374]
MTVDPTDPETFERDDNGATTAAFDEETPEADAAEQHTELRQRTDEPLTRIDPAVANPADAAEQARVVDLDEDDYR